MGLPDPGRPTSPAGLAISSLGLPTSPPGLPTSPPALPGLLIPPPALSISPSGLPTPPSGLPTSPPDLPGRPIPPPGVPPSPRPAPVAVRIASPAASRCLIIPSTPSTAPSQAVRTAGGGGGGGGVCRGLRGLPGGACWCWGGVLSRLIGGWRRWRLIGGWLLVGLVVGWQLVGAVRAGVEQQQHPAAQHAQSPPTQHAAAEGDCRTSSRAAAGAARHASRPGVWGRSGDQPAPAVAPTGVAVGAGGAIL